MRIATWNLKQAVAPRRPLPELWRWLEERVEPDVAVLTEAKIPVGGLPRGWNAVFDEGGIGPRRRWGTVVAGRGASLVRVESVRTGVRTVDLRPKWPGTLVVADVMRRRERIATVIGLYGLTVDATGKSCGHGGHSVPTLLRAIEPIVNSGRRDRIVLAGDFNLWPRDASRHLHAVGLEDLVEMTSSSRAPLAGCANCLRFKSTTHCGHLWTHRNGNSPRAAVQQIDFVCATPQMARRVRRVYGGVGHFTDAWAVSDHAPVVAEFR